MYLKFFDHFDAFVAWNDQTLSASNEFDFPDKSLKDIDFF